MAVRDLIRAMLRVRLDAKHERVIFMYYVYVLKSLKDSRYYFGQTKNIEKRVDLHNSGKVMSTKHRRPLVLVGYKAFDTRNEARWIEYNIKHHSDKKNRFIRDLKIKN